MNSDYCNNVSESAPHYEILIEKQNQLRLMHLNTQSMTSMFNEFLMTIQTYPFDIITLSETWLKDNHLLLEYVSVPGYSHEFRNRNVRGGGVGAYIRDNLKYKRRSDIEKLHPNLENVVRISRLQPSQSSTSRNFLSV